MSRCCGQHGHMKGSKIMSQTPPAQKTGPGINEATTWSDFGLA